VHEGKIWLHRKILDSDLWALSPSHIIVAEVCLLKANWETRTVRGMEVHRGQWLTHRKEIADLCPTAVTERVVRRALVRLRILRFLVPEVVLCAGRRYLLVTICKYDDYQTPKQKRSDGRSVLRSDGGPMAVPTLTEGSKDLKEVKTKALVVLADDFMAAWNSVPKEPMIRRMGKDYCRALARLSQDPDFRANWKEAVLRSRRGPITVSVAWFLRGDSNWQRSLEGIPRRRPPSIDPALAQIRADQKRVEEEKKSQEVTPAGQTLIADLLNRVKPKGV
jgi:hypothetical protein